MRSTRKLQRTRTAKRTVNRAQGTSTDRVQATLWTTHPHSAEPPSSRVQNRPLVLIADTNRERRHHATTHVTDANVHGISDDHETLLRGARETACEYDTDSNHGSQRHTG